MKLRFVALLTPFMLGALAARADTLGRQPVCGVDPATGNCVLMKVATDGTVQVAGSLSVSGTADLPGNTATFNANNVCTAVITAGEQSAGFHLTAGTLDGTLTPYITNQTGAINCATAGTCTATAFSSVGTIVVTNPSGVKDVGVNVVGGVRQVQVCTTTYNSGSATGVVTATFVQAASSGGGGGGSVTQGTDPWLVAGKGTAGSPSGGVVTVQGAASMTAVKTDGSGVTQPVSGTVTTTPPANASTNIAQVNAVTVQTGAGTAGTGTQRVAAATSDGAVLATANTGRLQVDVVTGGGSNASVVTDGAAPAGSDTQIGGSVTTSAPTYTTGQVKPFSLQTDGSLRVAVTAGGGSSASVSTTGSAVPGSADYIGANKGGNLTGLSLDGSGNLNVNVAAGGASGGTSSSFGAAFPATGTAAGAKVVSSAPTLTAGNMEAPNLTTAGRLIVDSSQVTQPVSGTVTANIGTSGSLALDASVTGLQVAQASTTSGQKGELVQGAVTTSAPTYTTGQTDPLSLTTAGALRTDSSATTQPVSGTVTANAGSGTMAVSSTQLPAALDGSGFLKTHEQGTATVSGTVTSNIGTTNGLALDATIGRAQASTTSGQTGPIVQGAVTTSAPTYTTGQTDPLSLTTAGALRTDSSATTQPVSGTVTANAGSGTFNIQANASTNLAQINGTTILTGNGVTGAGSPRVTIASDNTPFTVNAAQSGSWTVDISDRAARLLGVVYGSQGQQLKQTATNFNLQTEIAVGGTLIDPRSIRALTSSDTVTVVQGTGTNLHMVCDSGCTPGGSFADNTTFTAGSTAVNITAGEFNDTPLSDVTSGNAASARITKQRALHINLRDSSGNELGGAAAPVFTQEVGEQTYFVGRTALTPYAVAVAITSNAAKSICIRNLPESADFVWVGSSAQVNSTTGYPIAPGEEWCRTLSNTNLVFATTLAGASVAFDGTN